MRKFELESLLKSFLIFFLLQEILLSVIMWQNYQNGIRSIDDKIKSQMKVCSFDLKCEDLKLDFVPAAAQKEERDFFELITSLPSFGPSVALSILSHFSVKEFYSLIYNEDIKTLQIIKGLGKKNTKTHNRA